MAEVQYASNGKANLGVTLGAIGTGLGALAGAGGLSGIFGTNNPGDRPVTRYEMELIQKSIDKENEIVLLKSQMYANQRADALQVQIGQQAVWNATEQGVMGLLQSQVAQLMGLAKLGIPESSVTVSAFTAANAQAA